MEFGRETFKGVEKISHLFLGKYFSASFMIFIL